MENKVTHRPHTILHRLSNHLLVLKLCMHGPVLQFRPLKIIKKKNNLFLSHTHTYMQQPTAFGLDQNKDQQSTTETPKHYLRRLQDTEQRRRVEEEKEK